MAAKTAGVVAFCVRLPFGAIATPPVKTKANAENAALKAVAKAAYNLCYSQSANAGEKWDALRKALKEIEIEE